MASDLFDFAAERLENHTPLNRLEARGTLRIALKSAGLDPNGLTVDRLCVVFQKLMPGELEQRGIGDGVAACNDVIEDLGNHSDSAQGSDSASIDGVFGRLGGD